MVPQRVLQSGFREYPGPAWSRLLPLDDVRPLEVNRLKAYRQSCMKEYESRQSALVLVAEEADPVDGVVSEEVAEGVARAKSNREAVLI
jgi:hypothetical protein